MTTIGNSTAQPSPAEASGLVKMHDDSAASDPAMRWHEKLDDGTRVLIRPIRKEDANVERSFIEGCRRSRGAIGFSGR
jgi:hypothetical protein